MKHRCINQRKTYNSADICTCKAKSEVICMFGQRLKEERKRVGITQPQLAEFVGAAKRTVIDWEKDKSSPTAVQLMAMIDKGLDTNYLLTGQRSQSEKMPTDEAFLLDNFRKLSEQKKKVALQFLIGGIEGLQDNKPSIVTKGSIGAVNGGTATIHNNQSGFTQLPFLYACIFCCSLAWLLGVMANMKMMTDIAGSMAFGIPALVMWGIGIIMAIFGYQIGMEQHKRYNENKEIV